MTMQPLRLSTRAGTLAALVLALVPVQVSAQGTPAMPAASASAPQLRDHEFDCLADAHSRVKVSASVPGLVERILVERGDRVTQGQLLVELESSVEKAQLEIARAKARNDHQVEVARARAEFTERAADRYARLKQSNAGAVTATQFDEAMSQARIAAYTLRDAKLTLEAAQMEAQRAEAMLNQRRVTSPINGVVVERHMMAGEHRHEQATFMTIARIDPLHVEVFLPIALYGQTAPGAKADVTLEAPLGTRHEASVLIVDRVLDTASGTFGVRLALPNPDHAIPAGLRCRIRFRAG